MKFKNLKREFSLLVEGGQEVRGQERIDALLTELDDKKSKYTRKLKKGIHLSKRDSIEEKLEIVQSMLKVIRGM